MPSITTGKRSGMSTCRIAVRWRTSPMTWWSRRRHTRSEEHTSELQSRLHLVCRLLLEKKHKYVPTLGDDDSAVQDGVFAARHHHAFIDDAVAIDPLKLHDAVADCSPDSRGSAYDFFRF